MSRSACDWSAKRVVPGRDLWFSSGLWEVNFQLKGKMGPFNNLVAVKPNFFSIKDGQSVKQPVTETTARPGYLCFTIFTFRFVPYII